MKINEICNLQIWSCKKLNKFIENDISKITVLKEISILDLMIRNNVSCLSPYITHRLITEYETAKKF